MDAKRLRALIHGWEVPGLLLVGAYFLLHRGWHRKRLFLVMGGVFATPLLMWLFSPDGKTLATVGDEWVGRLWHVKTGRKTLLEGHQEPVDAVAFSPDGNLVASAGKDGTVKLWRVR